MTIFVTDDAKPIRMFQKFFQAEFAAFFAFILEMRHWHVMFTTRHSDAYAKRRALQIGPLYFSWSVARGEDD